jgi:hypothetical protein
VSEPTGGAPGADLAPAAAAAAGTGEAATPCPACRGRLYPERLRCADCGLEVSTRYAGNEFADLEAEQLHLLRIFVLCEGRIRDMEAALGVSYPTVKGRLAALRARLGLEGAGARVGAPESKAPVRVAEPETVAEILDGLTNGTLSYESAMARIRALRTRP